MFDVTRSATRPRATAAVLLLAGALWLAHPAAPASATPAAAACNPGWCTLDRPTSAELAAITAEADRIVARYADDTTALGRDCAALGATMRAHAADVRMIAYMWRATDADGYTGPVTGDAHTVETVPGTGIVHIARGFDALNPDRGLAAILQTARHEFAHLNGARQREGGFDQAAYLARACGPG